MQTTTNELRIYDTDAAGRPRVEYKHVRRGDTYAEATHRVLPPEFAVLVERNGRVDVADLTADERAWVDAALEEGLRA